jgi:hypothetical protein
MTTYWVNTKLFCGAMSVDSNSVVSSKGTAPCYIRYYSGRKFSDVIAELKRKKFLLNCTKLEEK